MSKVIFNKEYDGESVVDLDRDVAEALDSDFNESAKEIFIDEHGFPRGTFKVTIEWIEE